ncbi:MAG: hypothetical protein RIK87_03455 [Fuerstiella sp.]
MLELAPEYFHTPGVQGGTADEAVPVPAPPARLPEAASPTDPPMNSPAVPEAPPEIDPVSFTIPAESSASSEYIEESYEHTIIPSTVVVRRRIQ